jgi:hypothetical protein
MSELLKVLADLCAVLSFLVNCWLLLRAKR